MLRFDGIKVDKRMSYGQITRWIWAWNGKMVIENEQIFLCFGTFQQSVFCTIHKSIWCFYYDARLFRYLNHTKYVTCILYSIRRNLFEKILILLCSMSRTPNPSFGQTVTNILLNVSNIFNKTLINVRLIRTIKLSNCESHLHLQRHQYFNSHKQKFRKIHKKNGKTVSWARNLYLVGHFMGNQR